MCHLYGNSGPLGHAQGVSFAFDVQGGGVRFVISHYFSQKKLKYLLTNTMELCFKELYVPMLSCGEGCDFGLIKCC